MKSFLNKFNPNNPKNNQAHGQLSRQKFQKNSTLENRMSIILFCIVLGIGGTSLYYGTRPSALNSSKYVSHMIVHKPKKHHIHFKKTKKHSKSKTNKHLTDLKKIKQSSNNDTISTSSISYKDRVNNSKITSSSKASTQSVKSNDDSSKGIRSNQQPIQKSTSTSNNETNTHKSKPVTSQKQSNPVSTKASNTTDPKK